MRFYVNIKNRFFYFWYYFWISYFLFSS